MKNILEGRLPNRVPSVAGRGARLRPNPGFRAVTSPFAQHQVVRQQSQVLARPTPATSILHNPLLLLAILLIVNHLGRPFEFFLTGLKIPLVLCILAAIAVFITGAIRGFRTSVGLSLTAFVIWLLLATPTSTWRGGSARYALYYAGLWLVFYLILAAAPRSMGDIRRLDVIVVVACVTYMLIGSKMTVGRLAGEGTFGNSNDIALMGGFILPFLILLASRLSPVIRIIAILISAVSMVYVIGLTASRTAMLGLAVMILVYLIRSRPLQSVAIFTASGIGLAVILVSLPPTTLQRLSTTFEGVDAQDQYSEAAESSRSRLDLWKDAIDTTLKYPFFGIGPGQFIQYRFDHYRNPDGTTKHYLPTHQTFLEVSSEEGIPGLAIYVIFLSSIYMCIRRGIKLNVPNSHADWTFGRQMGVCLEAGFAYFVTFSFFITCDKHPHQFLIAGLAVALERVSRGLIGQAMPQVANKNATGNSSVLASQAASFRTAPQALGSRA